MGFQSEVQVFLDHLRFQILDAQHKEWFIARLLPHICITLTQQKFPSHSEALETTMKLESSPARRKNNIRMVQVQS